MSELTLAWEGNMFHTWRKDNNRGIPQSTGIRVGERQGFHSSVWRLEC